MRIHKTASHLGGLEHLLVRKPVLWTEIGRIVGECSETAAHGTTARRAGRRRQPQPPRGALETTLAKSFLAHGWRACDRSDNGSSAREIPSCFMKRRVFVQIASNRRCGVGAMWDWQGLYSRDIIDVGVEILPMKSLREHMSSGPSYYEGELYNLVREGRGVPGVPLVLVGVDA